MRQTLPVYGVDIETDTTVDGLDPAVAPVVTAALSGAWGEEVFTGPEPSLLGALDARLAELEPGVVATWNGAAFDLPFIAERAERYGLRLGLRLRLDPRLRSHHDPLPGHRGSYRARWHRHGHIDTYRLYRGDVGAMLRLSCSLKAIARAVGLAPVEVDRARIHELDREVLHAYAASDARLARVLTERRWSTASRFVDRFAEPTLGEAAPVTA